MFFHTLTFRCPVHMDLNRPFPFTAQPHPRIRSHPSPSSLLSIRFLFAPGVFHTFYTLSLPQFYLFFSYTFSAGSRILFPLGITCRSPSSRRINSILVDRPCGRLIILPFPIMTPSRVLHNLLEITPFLNLRRKKD